jgi:hypothetical protein
MKNAVVTLVSGDVGQEVKLLGTRFRPSALAEADFLTS